MDKSTSTVPNCDQVIAVPLGVRWSINHRLQELHIACTCPTDGTLRVHINCPVELMLVHSVVRRFSTSRQVGAAWLERCWHAPACAPDS